MVNSLMNQRHVFMVLLRGTIRTVRMIEEIRKPENSCTKSKRLKSEIGNGRKCMTNSKKIVDKPIAKVYGPDPSVFAHTDEDKDTDERLADRLATKKPTFFSRLFGFFKKEP